MAHERRDTKVYLCSRLGFEWPTAGSASMSSCTGIGHIEVEIGIEDHRLLRQLQGAVRAIKTAEDGGDAVRLSATHVGVGFRSEVADNLSEPLLAGEPLLRATGGLVAVSGLALIAGVA